jgi:hypothetical protein
MPAFIGFPELVALFFVVLAIFVAVVAPIIVAHKIGQKKNRLGWPWALFLGWLGVLVVALLPVGRRTCPRCAEKVNAVALVCKHCGTDLPPLPSEEPKPDREPPAAGVAPLNTAADDDGPLVLPGSGYR